MARVSRRRLCQAGWMLAALSLAPIVASAQPDLSKVIGAQACKECHREAETAWERTRHFASRGALQGPAAARIREALALKESPEASEACAPCHATVKLDGARRRVLAGVSCESCHGPAAEWVKVHADFGSGKTKATETVDHRDDRLGRSMGAGMLRPENFYRVVQNCFQCHTVPQEALVNRGGHPAGSAIELVAWSQGAMRHNYGADGRNQEAPLDHRRMILIIGQMLDVEFALRGLATATSDGPYAQALIRRGEDARKVLLQIAGLVRTAEIDAALKAIERVTFVVGNGPAMLSAADAVSAAAQDFGDQGHRAELAAVDPLLPTSDRYRGTPLP